MIYKKLLILLSVTWAFAQAADGSMETLIHTVYQPISRHDVAVCQELYETFDQASNSASSDVRTVIQDRATRIFNSIKIAVFSVKQHGINVPSNLVRLMVQHICTQAEKHLQNGTISIINDAVEFCDEWQDSYLKKQLGIQSDEDLFIQEFLNALDLISDYATHETKIILQAVDTINHTVELFVSPCDKKNNTQLETVTYLRRVIKKITDKKFKDLCKSLDGELYKLQLIILEKYELDEYASRKPHLLDLKRRHLMCLKELAQHGTRYSKAINNYCIVVDAYTSDNQVDKIALLAVLEETKRALKGRLWTATIYKNMIALLSDIEEELRGEIIGSKNGIIQKISAAITKTLASKDVLYSLLSKVATDPQSAVSDITNKLTSRVMSLLLNPPATIEDSTQAAA